MPCRSVTLAAVAALLASAGCVPVTEPVGAADKAEPDEMLVGTWTGEDGKEDYIVIDVPKVKGNPKGLMRITWRDQGSSSWFFVSAVTGHKYGSACLDMEDLQSGTTEFSKEGVYAKWTKREGRAYAVFRYSVKKGTAVLNLGEWEGARGVMKAQKVGANAHRVFETPAGWLAKFLSEEKGRGALFPATADKKLTRSKKK